MKSILPCQALNNSFRQYLLPKARAKPHTLQERIKTIFLKYIYFTASTGAASGALSESSFAADFVEQSHEGPHTPASRARIIAAYWFGCAYGSVLGAVTGPCALPYFAYKLYHCVLETKM